MMSNRKKHLKHKMHQLKTASSFTLDYTFYNKQLFMYAFKKI